MNLIKDFYDGFDRDYIYKNLINLYRIERKQTFPAYEAAARYTYDLAKEEGFETELLEFPADGKTVYQDKTCPLAWDITEGHLELISDVPGIEDPVICDYAREPLEVAKFSSATPKEGIRTRLVTEAQMKAGTDVEGALVLLCQSTRPTAGIIRMILDLGAIGWVSDFQEEGLNEDIDAVYWCNAATESGSWVGIAGERDYIGYQVSPRKAYYLRAAAEKGGVVLKAFSDGRRYEGRQYAVSAYLPGETDREVWILSHLYEPLVDDNSNGIIGSIEIMKKLRDMAAEGKIKLKYGVRFISASEMYGMAAVCEHFGGYLGDRCIGAINTDGTMSATDKSMYKDINATEAPDNPGFVGNLLMNIVCDRIVEAFPDVAINHCDHRYADDCFLSDTTTGLPTVWFRHTHKGYHHHSTQDEARLDMEATVWHLSMHAEWIRAMAATTEDEVCEILPRALEFANKAMLRAAKAPVRSEEDKKKNLAFVLKREQEKLRGLSLYADISEIEETCAKIVVPKPENEIVRGSEELLDYCGHFIFSRITRGFPHDQVNFAKEEKRPLPGSITYDKYADVLSRMDGKKNFKEIILEIEWDFGELLSDKVIENYLRINLHLARGGYLGMETDCILTADELCAAIEKLGVKKGETVLVHSALSSLGEFKNGTKTAIEALRKAVGEDGTFLAPAFARPYIGFEGWANYAGNYRPYDTREDGELRDKTINTGALPKAMLKEPDSYRSGHISHEWVAIGKRAEECVRAHRLLDAPVGKTSPLDKALELDGSVIFLGCSIGSNTFIHYLEDMADVPYLEPAIVKYIDKDGVVHTDIIHRHLPGCRSFYMGFDGYFYQEAIKRGLHIDEVQFGRGKLYRMKLSELYEIGLKMYKEEPLDLLCGRENCKFCEKYKK